MWLMMPPTNIDENREPMPRAAISAYTSFALNVTPSAESFSNASGGSMDSKDITSTQWATAISRMPNISGVVYAYTNPAAALAQNPRRRLITPVDTVRMLSADMSATR